MQTEDMAVTAFWVNEGGRPANAAPWETELEKSTISHQLQTNIDHAPLHTLHENPFVSAILLSHLDPEPAHILF